MRLLRACSASASTEVLVNVLIPPGLLFGCSGSQRKMYAKSPHSLLKNQCMICNANATLISQDHLKQLSISIRVCVKPLLLAILRKIYDITSSSPAFSSNPNRQDSLWSDPCPVNPTRRSVSTDQICAGDRPLLGARPSATGRVQPEN